jgi:hypothetical protein
MPGFVSSGTPYISHSNQAIALWALVNTAVTKLRHTALPAICCSCQTQSAGQPQTFHDSRLKRGCSIQFETLIAFSPHLKKYPANAIPGSDQSTSYFYCASPKEGYFSSLVGVSSSLFLAFPTKILYLLLVSPLWSKVSHNQHHSFSYAKCIYTQNM